MKSLDKESISEVKQAQMRDIEKLGPWFHNLHLPTTVQTAPGHPLGDFPSYKWEELAGSLPEDLSGWSVLDIGCNAGYYTFKLAERGAEVTGIDVDERYLKQARWAAGQFGLEDRVEFRQMQVYDLARVPEKWDLVLYLGVFYHLRYPLLATDIIAQKVRRMLVFQTLTMPGNEVYEDTYDRGMNDRKSLLEHGWPKMAFIEHRFAGDPTNWWIANRACIEALLRSSGMKVASRPEPEMFICEPDSDRPSCVTTWNAGELLSATGSKGDWDE